MRRPYRYLRRDPLRLLLLAAVAVSAPGTVPTIPYDLPLLWPEEQRAFLQDGPGLLLSTS